MAQVSADLDFCPDCFSTQCTCGPEPLQPIGDIDPRLIPTRNPLPAFITNTTPEFRAAWDRLQGAATAPAPVDEAERADLHAIAFGSDVARELHTLEVRQEARRLFTQRHSTATEPFDAGLLQDVLDRPDVLRWRIHGLHPAQGRLLIVAQRKTGKTTMLLNLARCYLTGEPFLHAHTVEPVAGTVAFLNYEVSAAQVARWAHEAGVPTDRLLLVNLRGRRNPLAHEPDRAALVALLREHHVDVLIVDPFARAFAGVGENPNDTGQVNTFTALVDEVATAAGIGEVVLANHSGWNKERGRNSTALEDWPDAIVTMVKDDDTGQRFMRAEGRDVDVEEDRLDFDPATRTLTLSGSGSRRDAKAGQREAELVGAVVDVITTQPGLGSRDLDEALRAAGHSVQRGDGPKAARVAADRGLIEVRREGRKSAHYPHVSHVSPRVPRDAYDVSPRPYRDGDTSMTLHTLDVSRDTSPPIHACSGPNVCQVPGCEVAS